MEILKQYKICLKYLINICLHEILNSMFQKSIFN